MTIRPGPYWDSNHGFAIRTDRAGRYTSHKPKFRRKDPLSIKPSAMDLRLVAMLEKSNYVRPGDLCPNYPDRAAKLMRRAGMVLYHEMRQLWVPDVGTYAWLVSIKQRIKNCRVTLGKTNVDTNSVRAPYARTWKVVPVSEAGDRQPLRFQDARTAPGELSEGYSSFG